MRPANPVSLPVHPDALRELVREVAVQVVAELDRDKASLPAGRLCFPEAEAAPMLGLQQHQLRDERLRGRIAYHRVVGNRVMYSRDDLLAYLRERRQGRAA